MFSRLKYSKISKLNRNKKYLIAKKRSSSIDHTYFLAPVFRYIDNLSSLSNSLLANTIIAAKEGIILPKNAPQINVFARFMQMAQQVVRISRTIAMAEHLDTEKK
eukprot:TRINITY_DN2869_c0_g1_i1.p1 TRINITY_DN2869_c0_g1~~TRINITY_DN2869_c0_g1_i1.p1  ORF type:complete len:105 (-),score=10.45 TRINITY_DN2869_c0_g1_i1:14-328(-)